MTWHDLKALPTLLALCEGNYKSTVESPHKGPVMWGSDVCYVSLNKLFNKQLSHGWYHMPRCVIMKCSKCLLTRELYSIFHELCTLFVRFWFSFIYMISSLWIPVIYVAIFTCLINTEAIIQGHFTFTVSTHSNILKTSLKSFSKLSSKLCNPLLLNNLRTCQFSKTK